MTRFTFNDIGPFYITEINQWKKDSRRSIKEYRSRVFFNRKDVRAALMTFAVLAYPFYRLLKRNSKLISFMLAATLPLLAPVIFT
jgi:hypothetical protein